MDTPCTDRFWTSPDGLKLHYRDYAGSDSSAPVICLPGLTRNARDFAELARHIAPRRRVLCPSFRGRGQSDYASDSSTYTPPTYAADVLALLDQEGIDRCVAVGTSLGGLVTMLLNAARPGLLTGAVLNDIGPVVDPAGIERIRGYVGQGRSFETWMHAARALRDGQAAVFPGYSLDDWLAMAKRCMVLGQNGRVVFDYDMTIAEPFANADNAAPPDLWPLFEGLGSVPLLIVRGALSDLLAPATVAEMQRRAPQAEVVTVPHVGHAPMLDEVEALGGIDRLLARAA
ncbi:MAG: alpha/beta fold hydrolase [Tsuneonella sp.]